jgi:hypothetical protein
MKLIINDMHAHIIVLKSRLFKEGDNNYDGSTILIPCQKNRQELARCGLIGKVHITSDMTEDEKQKK